MLFLDLRCRHGRIGFNVLFSEEHDLAIFLPVDLDERSRRTSVAVLDCRDDVAPTGQLAEVIRVVGPRARHAVREDHDGEPLRLFTITTGAKDGHVDLCGDANPADEQPQRKSEDGPHDEVVHAGDAGVAFGGDAQRPWDPEMLGKFRPGVVRGRVVHCKQNRLDFKRKLPGLFDDGVGDLERFGERDLEIDGPDGVRARVRRQPRCEERTGDGEAVQHVYGAHGAENIPPCEPWAEERLETRDVRCEAGLAGCEPSGLWLG